MIRTKNIFNLTVQRRILIGLMIVCSSAFAQWADKKEKQTEENSVSPSSMLQQNQQALKVTIQDGPVDPKEYIVGPGDIFSVNIWTAVPLSFQIPVSPEGSLIVPTVGEVMASGISLESVKQKVLAEIKKKYITGQSNVTLIMPRTFSVTLKGSVQEEKKVYVQATQRVDAVVNYTKKEITKEYIPGKIEESMVAQRNILVRHKDGTHNHVDIESYYATGESKYNPLLRDGDIVIVPPTRIEKNFIGVYGAVNRVGEYEYSEGDSLVRMIKIARELTSFGDSDHVVITRTNSNHHLDSFTVSLRKINEGLQSDMTLMQGDRIVVYEQYSQKQTGKVFVEGEIRFPGYYPISRDSTYLSEVIRYAGGVTERASLKNSQLFRQSVNQKDIEVERMESRRGSITPDDSAYYDLETNIRINRELVVTDFEEILGKENPKKDILLRDGDNIYIASKKKTVYVFGQVVTPGHILFTPHKDYHYYIQQAGGFTEDARSSDIKIIKASTRQWLDPSQTEIEQGDYIWIPKEPYHPFAYYMNVYGQLFSIVATVVSLIVLVTR